MTLTPEQRRTMDSLKVLGEVTASTIEPGAVLVAINGENTHLMEPTGEYTPIESIRRPVE